MQLLKKKKYRQLWQNPWLRRRRRLWTLTNACVPCLQVVLSIRAPIVFTELQLKKAKRRSSMFFHALDVLPQSPAQISCTALMSLFANIDESQVNMWPCIIVRSIRNVYNYDISRIMKGLCFFRGIILLQNRCAQEQANISDWNHEQECHRTEENYIPNNGVALLV